MGPDTSSCDAKHVLTATTSSCGSPCLMPAILRRWPAIRPWSLRAFKAFAAEADADPSASFRVGSKWPHLPGVRVHESRRRQAGVCTCDDDGLPRTDVARSAIDAAAWQPWPRFACAMVAAVVQQRLATARRAGCVRCSICRAQFDTRHTCGWRFADIAGGAEALSEIDLARLCRKFGLGTTAQQVQRRDSNGPAALSGRRMGLPETVRSSCLEVDGAHHLRSSTGRPTCGVSVIVISRRWVLRATTYEMRVEASSRSSSDLRAMRVSHRRVVSVRAGL